MSSLMTAASMESNFFKINFNDDEVCVKVEDSIKDFLMYDYSERINLESIISVFKAIQKELKQKKKFLNDDVFMETIKEYDNIDNFHILDYMDFFELCYDADMLEHEAQKSEGYLPAWTKNFLSSRFNSVS